MTTPRRVPRSSFLAVVLACLTIESTCRGADGAAGWPCWRGPTHDGRAAADERVPRTWSATDNLLWRADVPGRGNGSPIVVGDRICLATCDEASGSQSVLAYDRRTGARLWERIVHASGAMRKNERSTGASTTPAFDGERMFVTFATGGTVVASALDPDGSILWQTTVDDYRIHQGYGASPLVYEGFVVVAADHQDGGVIAALDRASGAVAWRRERPKNPNYPSPIVHRLFDRDQLIMTGCDMVIAYDPRTGATLWESAGSTTECVTTTVTDGRHVYSSGGYPRNHVAAVLADGSGTVVWENEQRDYVPSMLFHDGHLYAILDAGIAVCWDAASGTEKWKQRLGGNYSASPIMVGDTIYATSEAGETHVFRADPAGYEELAVNRLGDETFASAAVADGRLFLRIAEQDGDGRRERLVCIGR